MMGPIIRSDMSVRIYHYSLRNDPEERSSHTPYTVIQKPIRDGYIILVLYVVLIYRVIQKDGLNFVRLYLLNYTWYVNDLHNI